MGNAQAALGIINRNGLGKIRHIDIGLLWIQQVSAQQMLKFSKVLGKERGSIEHHTNRSCHNSSTGRAQEAPKLHCISQSLDECNMMGHARDWKWIHSIADALCKGGGKGPGCEKTGDLHAVCSDGARRQKVSPAIYARSQLTNDLHTTTRHDQQHQIQLTDRDKANCMSEQHVSSANYLQAWSSNNHAGKYRSIRKSHRHQDGRNAILQGRLAPELATVQTALPCMRRPADEATT